MAVQVPDYKDRDTLERLVEKHKNLDGVAEECFCSVSTIQKYMHIYGLKSKKWHGREPMRITINGETKTVPEWSKVSGLCETVIYNRHRKGIRGAALIERRR